MLAVGRMWRGEVSLAQSFWVWGVVALAALAIGGQIALLQLAMIGAGGVLFAGLLFGAGLLVYQVAVSVGVWRSAGRYSGPKAWAVLARAAVVLSFGYVVAGVAFAAYLYMQDTHDPSRTSANVAASLSRTADYPLTGFWKNSCSENFGLVIEPTAAPRTYSVSFCGPGGCFKPGTYRPNTTVVDDPMYRVIDQDTIEVRGQEGFSRYMRCQ